MKNTQKALLLCLCGALCAIIFACASAPPSGPQIVAGSWEWVPKQAKPDGDTSFCSLNVTEEVIDGKSVRVYNLSGTVTEAIQYGLSECDIVPDAATIPLLKTCQAVSFKILGDGRTYNIEFPIETVTDWAFHTFSVITTEGVVEDVFIPIVVVMQPAWGSPVKFEQNLLEKLIFKTKNNVEGGLGDWEVKIWDFALHIPAPSTARTQSAAPAPEVGHMGAFNLRLEDNFQYGEGYQGVLRDRNLLGGHRIEPGEAYTLQMTFTTSRDLEQELQFGFVDTTEAASYWRILSIDDEGNPKMIKIPACKAGEVVSGTYTIRTAVRSTGTGGDANALVFTTEGAGRPGSGGSGVQKAVTLNFTELVLTKVE